MSKISPEYLQPDQLWHITTEGDCEGKSTRSLGYYKGNIADIALYLADMALYSLNFTALNVKAPGAPTGDSVDVSFGLGAVHHSCNNGDLAAALEPVLGDKVKVTVGSHYQSINITTKTPMSPQEKLRQKALAKLTPEEIAALGLN